MVQVGCQMGCTFCATGSMGLKGNLTTGEILEQLVHASAVMPIRNIVFMVSSLEKLLTISKNVMAVETFHGLQKYFLLPQS